MAGELPLSLGTSYRPHVLAVGNLAKVRHRTSLDLAPQPRADAVIPTIHWRVLYVAKGSLVMPDGARLREGDACLIHPGTSGALVLSPHACVLHLLFDVIPRRIEWRGSHPISTDRVPQPGSIPIWGVDLARLLPPNRSIDVRILMQRLRPEMGTSPAATLRADVLLSSFLCDLVEDASAPAPYPEPVPGPGSDVQLAAVQRLAARLIRHNGNATVADLSRQSGRSTRQLQREFSAAGLPGPRAFLERLRLERAAHALRVSGVPIHAIATRVGYRSAAAFTRAFTRVMGAGPQRWRQRIR